MANANEKTAVSLTVPADRACLVLSLFEDKAKHSRLVAAHQDSLGNEDGAKVANDRADFLDSCAAPLRAACEAQKAAHGAELAAREAKRKADRMAKYDAQEAAREAKKAEKEAAKEEAKAAKEAAKAAAKVSAPAVAVKQHKPTVDDRPAVIKNGVNIAAKVRKDGFGVVKPVKKMTHAEKMAFAESL